MKRLPHCLFILLLSSEAFARGAYYCRSSICNFTGAIVLAALVGFFAISLLTNIHEKGFIKGISEYAAVRIIAWYVFAVGGLVFVVGAAFKLNEILGLSVLAFLMVALHYISKLSRPAAPNNNKQGTVKR